MVSEARREGAGAAHGLCNCSPLRVRVFMFTMNSAGVKISIPWCIQETVRKLNPEPFYFFVQNLFIKPIN